MDPAIAYGIVFTNFMRKGIYTFKDGTDSLVRKMVDELRKNGVELRRQCNVDKILTQERMGKPCVTGVEANGKQIRCGAVLSNANLKNTIEKMLGMDKLPPNFAKKSKDVRLNSTSCQVYIGLKKGEVLPESLGDLIFTSESPKFSTDELADFHTSSRTFSIYYPDTRPHRKEPRYSIVASLNAKWKDWANLSESEYIKASKDYVKKASLPWKKSFLTFVLKLNTSKRLPQGLLSITLNMQTGQPLGLNLRVLRFRMICQPTHQDCFMQVP